MAVGKEKLFQIMIGIQLMGRMGNHLFEYSFVRIVGDYLGVDYGIVKPPSNFDYDWHVGEWQASDVIDCDVTFCSDQSFSKVHHDINDAGGYDKNVFREYDLSTLSDDTLFLGIFQNGDIIKRIDPLWFRVKNDSHKLPFDPKSTCVIHFRGYDYVTHFSQYRGSDFDFTSYYEHAKETIMKMCGNLDCVVITDDLENAMKFVKADHYISDSKPSDFFTLSLAKYVIGSPSTFSWWASFLNKNLEVCISPSGWLFYQPKQNIQSTWCYTDKFTWI